MLREAIAEHRHVSNLSEKYSYPQFDSQKLKAGIEDKPRNVFYILGSSSSVENLTPHNFQTISGEVSVGVNAWALHDFVPDIYSFEPVTRRDRDHYWTMKHLDRPEVLRKAPAIMFLKPRSAIELEQLRMVPEGLIHRTMLYGRVQPFTRSKHNLVRDLEIAGKLALDNLSVLPDSGASIVRMAFLGLRLGFPRIVFVGVDLNHTEYFWQRNPSHLRKFGLDDFDSAQTATTHETLGNRNRAFGVIDMLVAMSQLMSKFGSRLEVASPASMLADFLPVHSW